MKIKEKISYSKYMFLHSACAGCLGLIGEILGAFPSTICDVLSLVCTAVACVLIFLGMIRKKDKPDEMTYEILHKCHRIAMLVLLFILLFAEFVYGGTKLSHFELQVNVFRAITAVGMVIVFLYIMVVGISYRIIEGKE